MPDAHLAALAAARAFAVPGELLDVCAYRRGHIHDTFISTWRVDGGARRYLHQRVNTAVFRDVPALMHNVERVTRHLEAKYGSSAHPPHTLVLVPTLDGAHYLDGDGEAWRTYNFIENTESFDRCATPELAHEAARAFGAFQASLVDLDPAELRETIPNFFSSPARLRQLDNARGRAVPHRAARAAAELRFVEDRRDQVGRIEAMLASGALPRRIVHGDTKLNNVLFDCDSGEAVCVVDLDTCMPAWSLYDFGDLVRFTAATSAEDEVEVERIGTDLELYRALVEGYLESAHFLTAAERELMPFAARLVTMTIGMRFLADYLLGDVYFKTARPEHNLERARVQLRMVEGMERRADDMVV